MWVQCKSKVNSNKIFNLFKVTKEIYTFRLKKTWADTIYTCNP